MTGPANSLKFTRINSDGVYYPHLKTSLRHSVKFDVFDNNEQIATLATNNRKTFTLTKEDIHLSIKSNWSWQNKWRYFIFKDNQVLLAKIYIHRPVVLSWFRPTVYTITFEKSGCIYSLTRRRRKDWKYINADFCYDFTLDGEIKCSIVNLKKVKGFYNPRTIAQEGIIEYEDPINLEQVLCFLQFMNIAIDMEFDI